MSTHVNLLGEPAPTLLPGSPEPEGLVAAGAPAADIAARYPAFSLAWAMLAEPALAAGGFVEAYAYARTGYHRGLDALRRNGWKGHGPIPGRTSPTAGSCAASPLSPARPTPSARTARRTAAGSSWRTAAP